jgi:hypothetical protein
MKGDGRRMVKCPICGKEVTTPIKEWDLNPNLRVELYECCGKRFRQIVCAAEEVRLHGPA